MISINDIDLSVKARIPSFVDGMQHGDIVNFEEDNEYCRRI